MSSSPIRVLQVVTQMNRAGLENRLMDLYRHINKEEVQFDFYTCRMEQGFYDDEIRHLGGRVYYGAPLSISKIFTIPRRFHDFLTDHQEYALVHCHLDQWCGFVLLGAKMAGVSVRIAHARTSLEKFTLKNLMKNIIKLPVNGTATDRLAVSLKAARWLYGNRVVQKGEIVVLPNAIEVNKFVFNENVRTNMREALGLSDRLLIVHVGNIRPEKNHDFLIEVLAELLKIDNSYFLLVIGSDYMNGKIQQKVYDMNLNNHVRFLGSRSDVSELLCAADIFVFPSLYEGFPGAVLEAQASGLPCFVSDSVTHEVSILPSTQYLSLKLTPWQWARAILDVPPVRNREQAAKLVVNAGYNITELSELMMGFYKQAVQRS